MEKLDVDYDDCSGGGCGSSDGDAAAAVSDDNNDFNNKHIDTIIIMIRMC